MQLSCFFKLNKFPKYTDKMEPAGSGTINGTHATSDFSFRGGNGISQDGGGSGDHNGGHVTSGRKSGSETQDPGEGGKQVGNGLVTRVYHHSVSRWYRGFKKKRVKMLNRKY